MKFLIILLLFPFTILYGLITDLRNFLYEKGYFKSTRFNVFTINAGNLTVGGTGKTPHVEYLIRLLKDSYSIATLSRGYGRQTNGFYLADKKSSAETIGDEPMQFYRRFGDCIRVAVGEKRVPAISHLLSTYPEIQIVLLDDAYQHRAVHPHLNILLTDYHRLFTRDYPFPAGRLREGRKGASRADLIVVSKCPSALNHQEREQITQEVRRYAKPQTPVFFSSIRYGKPIPFHSNPNASFSSSVILISGIAQADLFEDYAAKHFQVLNHFRFKDHYAYTEQDFEKFELYYQQNPSEKKCFLATEKDFVKLASPSFDRWTSRMPFFYIPIEIYWLDDTGYLADSLKFDSMIEQAVHQHNGTL